MKFKRLLLIILLPILLLVFTSCANDNIKIIAQDIGDYYEGIDAFTIYSQDITMNAKIVKEDDKAYLRLEGNISEWQLLSGNEFVFHYERDFKRYIKEGIKINLDVGCYIYADIELDDTEYYITNIGYYLNFVYDCEYIYQNMYVPSKNDISKFSYSTFSETEFKKTIKWNINKISLNDNICYMFYVDSLTDKKFHNRFRFEIYRDGVYYPEVKFTNNNKRIYIILEPNKKYYQINIRYEYMCTKLFGNLNLINDYPYEY